ncbi:DUF481 domain-containing protein [Gilvibacter sp.]|uniref:DUF481 domain-containing protein n=1 Tax=Gilvibacter sp. TaxID=2729997 RepID=UPI0025C6E923|nr:DUF481 domain-containing protein [Gilvibacter sp.]NQX77180.1 DUF481 domain-containing protein [Gilvibacter sp.]
MKKLLMLLLLFSSAAQAQILNAESLRKVTDTSGWSGSATVNFALVRNVNDIISLGSDVHVQYKTEKHLFLLKNQIAFRKLNDDDFSNFGITHLRYNYVLSDRWRWEAFAQGQYNRVALIDFRGLLGTGPRYKISSSEDYKFYLGNLVMFEYEEVADGITPNQRDVRLSSYLSFSLFPNDNLSLVSTTYYQPQLDQWSDFRISSESTLLVKMFKNLNLNVTYVFIYDAFPAIGIPNSQYRFSTGVTYTFD